MLMAAGLGTRLSPFTQKIAKPLIPLLGIPMAQFSFDLLTSAKVETVVINVHHLAQHTAQSIRFLEGPKNKIISDESTLLLGSAGGLAKALPYFNGEPFFYLNSDTYTHIDLNDLAQHHFYLKHQYGIWITLCVLLEGPKNDSYREVIFNIKNNLARGLGPRLIQKPFFSGVAVIEPDAVLHVSSKEPSSFVDQILQPALKLGKVGVYPIDNTVADSFSWLDIGTPRLWHSSHFQLIRYMEAEELPSVLKKRILKSNQQLKPGVWASSLDASTSVSSSHWGTPSYWGSDGIQKIPPTNLPANTVLYGTPSVPAPEGGGIGFRGLWTPLN